MEGKENNRFSPEYTLTDGDRRIIKALAKMWQGNSQSPYYEGIELELERRKPLGVRNFREIKINSAALKLSEESKN